MAENLGARRIFDRHGDSFIMASKERPDAEMMLCMASADLDDAITTDDGYLKLF